MTYNCERLDVNLIKISDEFVFNINLNSGWCIGQVEFDENTKPIEEFKVTFTKRKDTGTTTADH